MNRIAGYEKLVRPVLFSLDPERAHGLTVKLLRRVSSFRPALRLLDGFQPVSKRKTVFGLTFPNPVGLAAGLDKNGEFLPALAALGFGFAEIGTITARSQPGNAKPRIFRYPRQQALINRLGFNNDGADAVARRLRCLRESGRWPAIRVGINIGKSKTTPLQEAPADYLYSFRCLRQFADYMVLNVSSPNTPGLRSLQEPNLLIGLLRAISEENRENKPVLIKISPDVAEAEVTEIIQVCEEYRVAGIVATNTTIDHSSIPPTRDQAGGLSGAPLREKSTAIVRILAQRSRLPVIACGGIFDAASARQKIEAGAALLQIYTGFIYRGPRILRELSEALS